MSTKMFLYLLTDKLNWWKKIEKVKMAEKN